MLSFGGHVSSSLAFFFDGRRRDGSRPAHPYHRAGIRVRCRAGDRSNGRNENLGKNAQRTLTSARHYQFARSNSIVPHICPFPLTPKLTHLYTASLLAVDRKDQKKVTKLEAQIPYHEGRGEKEEAEKIRQKIDAIWAKAKEAAFAM